jgi:hypothetical protein
LEVLCQQNLIVLQLSLKSILVAAEIPSVMFRESTFSISKPILNTNDCRPYKEHT